MTVNFEAIALEVLQRALTQGSVAAGEQLLRDLLSALPQDKLILVRRITGELLEARKPKFTVSGSKRG
jgi:hypothetical protein